MQYDDQAEDACRRGWLRAAATLTFAAAVLPLTGCASKPAGPPPPPPKPLAHIGVLPVLLQLPADQGAGFGARGHGGVYVHSGPPISAGAAVATLGVGLIAMAIMADRAQKRRDLDAAVADLAFDPAKALDEGLAGALQKRQVVVTRIEDPVLAAEIRSGSMERLPPGVDALLDVRVTEAGYFSSMRAGGYSPMLNVSASLLPPVKGGEELEAFGYYADWRDGGKDSRWFKTPAALTVDQIDKIRSQSQLLRDGLVAVVARVLERMADDVQRRAAGQPRVDLKSGTDGH